MNILAVTLILLLPLAAFGAGFPFPSSGSSKSPDGRWTLICKTSENRTNDLWHSIILTDRHGGVFRLLNFGRHCDALWSPNSSRVALTDWSGSDISDILICSVANPESHVLLSDVCTRSRMPIAPEECSGHCYFEASKWLDGNRLRVRVFGNSNEKVSRSFEHRYVFDAARGSFENVVAK